ncbi:LLM class flavin-dependent oxidoreductase [Actinomycetospora endophytica]|uniref:LLM class flavin-dependent oxidoreductase n=1 Tax=Actinomycetospora endophytica TaxID=2291215 RepID=A0ABS8PFH1_9PSEU|nr:LLM class flavin-dependent oxidoreductase [Actinomycetospora endophytica]MCD2197016.1 LLM class flavin-dependent oxidoreductase [Actinomycetospora endophytica]
MRVGVFLISPRWPGRSDAQALAGTMRLARLADDLGYADVWLAEHHFSPYGVCPSAVVLAGHVLGVTSRVGVGTAVSVLPTTRPVALAEQAALLDAVAPGRLRLGVGRGGPWRELDVLGDGIARWSEGFGADLDVLLDALRGVPVALPHGDAPLVPAPPSAIPVRVAATSADTVTTAADRGLPLLLGMHADDAEKRAQVDAWTGRAGWAGEHVAVGIAHVASSVGAARTAVRDALPRWLRPGLAGYVRADGHPTSPRDPDDYADLLTRLHPLGTASDCAARLAETAQRSGVGQVALMMQTTGEPAAAEHTLRAIAGHLPALAAV